MKSNLRTLICLSTIIFIVAFSTGCRKAYINGDLDGQWQVMSIEYQDGTLVSPERTYYRINLHTMQLFAVGYGQQTANMTYDRDEASIYCDFPRSDVKALSRYGISSNPVNFKILEMTSKKLVLSTDGTVISCRKF